MKKLIAILVAILSVLTVSMITQVMGYSFTSAREKSSLQRAITELSLSEVTVVKMTLLRHQAVNRVDLTSHVGGTPYLDEQNKYPAEGDISLCFLAQINLGEVPEIELLPQKGLLQFFVSCDLKKEVAYVRMIPVHSEMIKQQAAQAQVLGTRTASIVTGEYSLKFQLNKEYISYTNNDAPALALDKNSYRAIEQYTGISAVGDYSKLSGYPYFKKMDLRNTVSKRLLAQFIVDERIFQFYGTAQQLTEGNFEGVKVIIQE